MSPEQASVNSDRIDQRTDIFGSGAVLDWLLTSVPPFSGGIEILDRVIAKAKMALAKMLVKKELDLKQATVLLTDVLSIRRTTLADPRIARCLHALGVVAHKQGDFAGAETCFSKAVVDTSALLRRSHEHPTSSEFYLASCEFAQAKRNSNPVKARSQYQRGMDILKEVFTYEHASGWCFASSRRKHDKSRNSDSIRFSQHC